MIKLIDEILDRLCLRVNEIENNHRHFSKLVELRSVNEKLLQLETLRIISCLEEVVDYLPEKYYPDYGDGTKRKVDIWFKTRFTKEYWMEIKMRATNYGKRPDQTRRNLRAGIVSISKDIERLRQIDNKFNKLMLVAFLPMYDAVYEEFISEYLSKIECGILFSRKCVSLEQNGYLDLHIISVE